ncbi:Hypothetical predicted protein [Cloeon dipterum]|uniref:BACK domain-containing protein n=1 Tax=Cloeon dipterum TaxID=197152 RepID=A0A8S1E0X2_9INSE|nr:Hypothetical predicted protein [Cloeon dipterum]
MIREILAQDKLCVSELNMLEALILWGKSEVSRRCLTEEEIKSIAKKEETKMLYKNSNVPACIVNVTTINLLKAVWIP